MCLSVNLLTVWLSLADCLYLAVCLSGCLSLCLSVCPSVLYIVLGPNCPWDLALSGNNIHNFSVCLSVSKFYTLFWLQTVHEIWLCPGRFFPIFPIFLSPGTNPQFPSTFSVLLSSPEPLDQPALLNLHQSQPVLLLYSQFVWLTIFKKNMVKFLLYCVYVWKYL